ncbi:MAG TPA: peptide deformylase [Bacteriovoracaceae bacterium]|nr:peptide deformylase [Bacteriovoracaceae bacterium]
MIRPLCRMGHPVLRLKARKLEKVEIFSDNIARLILDMRESMKHYGGIGIAAPQIGESLQIALIELPEINRYGETVDLPLTTFINPVIEYLTVEEQGFWEGCLSVPGLRGFVERPKQVKVTYLNEKGEVQEIVAEGFLATVLQHELDHLTGTLYVDRIRDLRLLSYQDEFDTFVQGKDTIE